MTGNDDGNIIAIIIAPHMSSNIPAASTQLWPGMRIHIIDIVQPPGISIPPPIVRQK
jgi:hypothetical protein